MTKISPVTGHYVDVEADGLRYKVFYLENGTGQPLVCQHTAGCHNHQWRGLLEDEEITKNYRVIAYDLPRHGKSDPPENTKWWTEEYRLTADHYANFIVALVDALELENPIFMGSSFGGNIALQLAYRRPDRFAGVTGIRGVRHHRAAVQVAALPARHPGQDQVHPVLPGDRTEQVFVQDLLPAGNAAAGADGPAAGAPGLPYS